VTATLVVLLSAALLVPLGVAMASEAANRRTRAELELGRLIAALEPMVCAFAEMAQGLARMRAAFAEFGEALAEVAAMYSVAYGRTDRTPTQRSVRHHRLPGEPD
jgi:hypothetical protein